MAGEVKRYFRDSTWSVRPPRGLQEAVLAVRAAQSDLAQQLGHAPTSDQLAEVTELDARGVNSALVAEESFSALSLDAPVHGSRRGDDRRDDRRPVRRVRRDRHERGAAQHRPATLSERERLILSLRFDHEMTQEQIGTRLGVSQMQVSRTLAQGLRVLRERLQDDGPAAEGPRARGRSTRAEPAPSEPSPSPDRLSGGPARGSAPTPRV